MPASIFCFRVKLALERGCLADRAETRAQPLGSMRKVARQGNGFQWLSERSDATVCSIVCCVNHWISTQHIRSIPSLLLLWFEFPRARLSVIGDDSFSNHDRPFQPGNWLSGLQRHCLNIYLYISWLQSFILILESTSPDSVKGRFSSLSVRTSVSQKATSEAAQEISLRSSDYGRLTKSMMSFVIISEGYKLQKVVLLTKSSFQILWIIPENIQFWDQA